MTISKKRKSLKLSIIDNGIGIVEENIKIVLTAFGQAPDTRDMNKHGTGLGLPIVKQLVELHGDRFELFSKIGVGTTAVISMNC